MNPYTYIMEMKSEAKSKRRWTAAEKRARKSQAEIQQAFYTLPVSSGDDLVARRKAMVARLEDRFISGRTFIAAVRFEAAAMYRNAEPVLTTAAKFYEASGKR